MAAKIILLFGLRVFVVSVCVRVYLQEMITYQQKQQQQPP